MKLVTVAEMQAIERESDEQGWTFAQMMEKAGQGLADIVQSFYGYEDNSVVTGLVGSGNNGGDTLIALAVLAEQGWLARAYIVRDRPKEDSLIERVLKAGGEVAGVLEDHELRTLDNWAAASGVMIDGVFGTGIRLPLQGDAALVLNRLKNMPELPAVVAVDCPSGVDLNTGEAAEETIPADVTVCMAAVKTGLLRFPAFQMAGDIEVVDIGLPEDLPAWNNIKSEVVTDETIRRILPVRKSDSHKGTWGTVQVVAGSVSYTGAALLCSRAAYRIGAGLVQIGIPAPLHAALAGQIPEATWVLLPSQMGVISESAVDALVNRMERVTVLLWGPGFGTEETTAGFVRRLLEGKGLRKKTAELGFVTAEPPKEQDAVNLPPMVIDADGLKLMAKIEKWWELLSGTAVLTPHPGEMAILTGKTVPEIQADRMGIAQHYAREWGHVLVLKGAMTLIAAPDGRVSLIPVATSALAHAGTGDVLAGMIAGLRSQGVEAYEAAVAGAWIHAQAGLLAAEESGAEASVAAGDLIEVLPEVLSWVWH